MNVQNAKVKKKVKEKVKEKGKAKAYQVKQVLQAIEYLEVKNGKINWSLHLSCHLVRR